MIPGKIIRFLEQYANVGIAATRTHELRPHGHRVCGWHVGDGGRTLTVLLAEPLTHLLESLDDNGQIALTVEEIPSHETYQFKGRYLGRRAVEPVDLEAVERTRERFVRGIQPIYPDVPLVSLRSFTYKPSLAVEFEVREVYLQTPGPGAGARIFPPAEA
jgi:hypothetical protein